MLRRKLTESLTARIFLLTFLILLSAGAVTFGIVAWATPITYTSVVNDDLQKQVDALAIELSETDMQDCGPILDAFIRSAGADLVLVGPDGMSVNVGSSLAVRTFYEGDDVLVTTTGDVSDPAGTTAIQRADTTGDAATAQIIASDQDALFTNVTFADQEEIYSLYVAPRVEAENLAVRALVKMAPLLVLMLLAFSALCALVYSRYITRPIVRLSGIAGKMAELDFGWSSGEQRRDEIGVLSRSLDQMARRLSAAMTELEAANQSLRGEVERERELDRQRMAFFSAASHELKTPVTILKGQLTGMLEGVDVSRDRDKYLLRSLHVTGRMESLIQEMLTISRMETGTDVRFGPVDLSELTRKQLSLDGGLLEQRGQRLTMQLTPGLTVTGEASLLEKVVGNLLSNASLYSPEGAEIRVWCGMDQGCPALTVENTGTHIREDALPHLFEAFYREEVSRNRGTGGSGLGLYLVRIILERHGASCFIENTEDGVRAVVRFPQKC